MAEGETPVVDAVFDSLGIQTTDNVVDQVESALQRFGIDITNVSNAVQDLVDTLPENSSQFGDRVVEILNNLGNEGQSLGDRLRDLIDSDDVSAITDQVESLLDDAGIDIGALAQQVEDFASSVADDGLSLRDAILRIIDSNDGGTLREGIVDLLESESLTNVRSEIETQLNLLDINIDGVQSAINDFTARLASGETPVRDWIAGLVTTDQASGISAQLFAESESLGENIDGLISVIADDVTNLSDSVGILVSDLTNGSSSVGQLVDDILDSLSGDSQNSIGSLVDSILKDVDGFLENLFPDGDFLDNLLDDLLS